MVKKSVIVFLLVFGTAFCTAQKVIQKEIASEGIQTLSIADDIIYKITIQSSEASIVKISAQISGEHAESVVIETRIIEETLSLKTGFTPFFDLENDKLAAHKVMAIEMEIALPKEMAVEIKSKLASVNTDGIFKNLDISIENGNCNLTNFSGNAHIKTMGGNIAVWAKNTVSGEAISKNGTVGNELPKQRKFLVEAESSSGNISLLQTE